MRRPLAAGRPARDKLTTTGSSAPLCNVVSCLCVVSGAGATAGLWHISTRLPTASSAKRTETPCILAHQAAAKPVPSAGQAGAPGQSAATAVHPRGPDKIRHSMPAGHGGSNQVAGPQHLIKSAAGRRVPTGNLGNAGSADGARAARRGGLQPQDARRLDLLQPRHNLVHRGARGGVLRPAVLRVDSRWALRLGRVGRVGRGHALGRGAGD